MADLLFELLSEEIPSRMQHGAAVSLKKLVTCRLVDAGLTYEAAREYWTPCRLALDLRGLSTRSNDIYEERKGPSVNASQAAITGFLRFAKLSDMSEAKITHNPRRGDHYIAKKIKRGRSAQMILAEVLPDILQKFPWPKSMRWGATSARSGSLRWIRPLHSILCLLTTDTDSEVIDFEIGGLRSGNTTYGHRFMCGREPIVIRRFSDYMLKLNQAYVIPDAEKRRENILADVQNLCFSRGLDLVEDNELAEEITGLVEWPVALIGEFDEKFLAIPPEIIRLSIRSNQKCFVTRKRGDKASLSNHFIVIANIEARDNGKKIVAGNSMIIRARLFDALYFWHADQIDLPDVCKFSAISDKFKLDLKKPLDQRMARLDYLNVTFHAKLGTQGERVIRIAALSVKIAPLVGANSISVYRAATLAKADLQTEIVGEFPELQGLMGRIYATLQGEDDAVSLAIEEHYKPQGQKDAVPCKPVSIALALADKIDTLVGFWLINEKPTGSRDPYALRRTSLGIIRLILSHKWKIHLMPLFQEACFLLKHHIIKCQSAVDYKDKLVSDNVQDITDILSSMEREKLLAEINPVLEDLLAFLHERLKVYLRDEDIQLDVIDAVQQTDDLLQMTCNAKALITFINTNDGKRLLGTAKRITNILDVEMRKNTSITSTITQIHFLKQEEIALHDAILKVEMQVTAFVQEGQFLSALLSLVILIDPVDSFFERVFINDDNLEIKKNRLAMLAYVHGLILQVADFSRLFK